MLSKPPYQPGHLTFSQLADKVKHVQLQIYLGRLLNRRDSSQRSGMDPQASQLFKEALSRPDPYTDYMIAKEKSRYGDWEGKEGSIHLLKRSIKSHPTSMAYLELAISKKGLILKDGNIDESAQIELNLNTMCGEKEEKETKPRSSHQQSRKDKSKGAPPPPPPPPSPPLALIANQLTQNCGLPNSVSCSPDDGRYPIRAGGD
eukprot:sb/3470585/